MQRLRSGHSGFAEALSFPVQRLSVLSPPSPVVDLVVGDCFTCSGRAQVAVIWRAPYRALGPALNQPITVMTCVEVEIFFVLKKKEKKLKNIKSDETEEMRSLVAMLSISKLFLSIFVNGPFQTLSGADIMFLWKGKKRMCVPSYCPHLSNPPPFLLLIQLLATVHTLLSS